MCGRVDELRDYGCVGLVCVGRIVYVKFGVIRCVAAVAAAVFVCVKDDVPWMYVFVRVCVRVAMLWCCVCLYEKFVRA